MPLIRIDTNPTPRQLAVFTAAWAAVAGGVAGRAWHDGHATTALGAAAAAGAMPLAFGVFRRAVRWAYVGLSYATYPVGVAVSCIVLAAAYYAVITPVGVLMRLLGRDPLSRRFDPGAPTYWQPRRRPRTPSEYFRQR